MNGGTRTLGVIIMVMILLISIIYLAYSIDTIRSSVLYGDIFRPHQGLSIFNIIVSAFGIFLAIFCLFVVSSARVAFCRMAAIGCMVFALFAFGSLIAALALNYIAIDHVSSRYINYMDQYASSADARNIISAVQINYDCCGNNVWNDWAEVHSHTTTTTTTKSTRSTKTSRTSTSTPLINTEKISTSTDSNLIIDYDENTEETTTTTKATRTTRSTKTTTAFAWNIDSDTDGGENSDSSWNINSFLNSESHIIGQSNSEVHSDFEINGDLDTDIITTTPQAHGHRQSTSQRPSGSNAHGQASHGIRKRAARPLQDIHLYDDSVTDFGLLSTTVLPGSCCLNRSSKPSDSIESYCTPMLSSSNNVRKDGCSKKLAKGAIGQTLGTAVINSLLIVLALLSVPILNRIYPVAIYHQKIYRKPSVQKHLGADPYTGPSVIDGKPRDSVVNSHADYSVYQNNAYVQNQ